MEYPQWYKDVYGASQFPKSDQEYWKRVRDYVIERDDLRCQACRKKASKKKLTVHHIIPRSEGGNDELENLISLHYSCHDYVEARGFRAAREIVGCTRYLEKSELLEMALDVDIQPEPEPEQEDTDVPENDRAEIICPCGVYHPRKKSQIGKQVTEIKCSLCGRVGLFVNEEWRWNTTLRVKPVSKNNSPAEKEPKPKIKPVKTEKVYSRSLVTCPVCNTEIMYTKIPKKYNGIKCTCGCLALLKDGEFYWNVMVLGNRRDVYKEKKK